MDDIFIWLETHPTTINFLQWTLVVVIAWFSGVFRWLRTKTRSPKLEVVPTASMAFLENLGEFKGVANTIRISFIVHASIINKTTDRIVIDRFKLSYRSSHILKSMQQKILRQAFPSWPRKRLGESYKLMGAFFTTYGDDYDAILSVSGLIESREMASGYLLFVSNTYGSWNPKIENGKIKVRLICSLTTGETLSYNEYLRVTEDHDLIEEFCPGLVKHVAHDSTWNHII